MNCVSAKTKDTARTTDIVQSGGKVKRQKYYIEFSTSDTGLG